MNTNENDTKQPESERDDAPQPLDPNRPPEEYRADFGRADIDVALDGIRFDVEPMLNPGEMRPREFRCNDGRIGVNPLREQLDAKVEVKP